MDHSFKFLRSDLNDRLIENLQKSRASCSVDGRGAVRYSDSEVDVIENEIISRLRTHVFPHWQLVCCPSDWVEIYRRYMLEHAVPFIEESYDGELMFLIPRKYRPHAWKLQPPQRRAARQRAG